MPKKEIESTKIDICIENEHINLYGVSSKNEIISFNIPFGYVNPIFNIISQLIDDDIPAILEKDHGILKTEPWSMTFNFTIAPQKLFNEDD